jgi:uncharacterized glyoxalase superfamily protein PhnB
MPDDQFDHFFVAPSNFDATLDFYAETLGWNVTSQWGSPGEGRGATLESGKVQVAIAEKHVDNVDDKSNSAINGTRPTLYIAVDDLDGRFSAMKDRSTVVVPPSRTHWGIFWFVVRDPDGNLIAFTQRG